MTPRISDPSLAKAAERRHDDVFSAWRPTFIVGGVALAVLIALFWETAFSMVEKWYQSATFNHGFLIVPIVGYLIWERRQVLAPLTPRPALWAAAVIAAGAFGWLLGHVAGVVVVQQLSLVIMLQALVVAILGWRIGKAIMFPLAYLFFAVPIGEFLVPYLQDITAFLAVQTLRLVGVPVFAEGVRITVPTGSFVVAEICAGLRFLIANIALGSLFANLSYRSWWRRFAFMGLCVVVPVIANGLRAFGIILIAYLSDNRLALGIDHIVYGWIFFTFVMFVLLGLGMTFRDRPMGVAHGEEPALAGVKPVRLLTPKFALAAVVSLLVAATAPAYALYIDTIGPDEAKTVQPPKAATPWAEAADVNPWRPALPGADLVLAQSYDGRHGRVNFAIVYYSRQTQGHEVVNYRLSAMGKKDWLRVGGGRDQTVVDGTPIGVSYLRYGTPDGNKLVWYWYWVEGVFTGNPYLAKLLEVKAKLLGGVRGAAVVAVAADYGENRDEAVKALNTFLASVEPLGPLLLRMAGRE